MQKLIAQSSILFENKIYEVCEELPTHNEAMVEAWISAGTAIWVQPPSDNTPAAIAKPRTAEPGLPGIAAYSEAEDGVNLVGKVPKTAARKKK